MNILAIDQARSGAWSIFDYGEGRLLETGVWSFPTGKYPFAKAVMLAEREIETVLETHDIDAVFLEDIQMRKDPRSFKRLAQLQGVLVNLLEKHEYLYDFIAPSQWQSYCKARGRTAKEVKDGVSSLTGAKASKVLSMDYVKDRYGIETENDNLADAVCIGDYVCGNIPLSKKNERNDT